MVTRTLTPEQWKMLITASQLRKESCLDNDELGEAKKWQELIDAIVKPGTRTNAKKKASFRV